MRWSATSRYFQERLQHPWCLCKASVYEVAGVSPFLDQVPEACSLGGGYQLQICPISTQQHKCVTITAGKWKVLWGKQTALIHIAVWRPAWTRMSHNIDQVARSFIFLLFIFNSWVEEGRVEGLPRAKWNNGFLLMAQSVTSVIKKGHFWRCKWATCTNMCN